MRGASFEGRDSLADVEAKQAWDQRESITFVDVREFQEWDAGRIDGSVHIPLMELSARVDEVPSDRKIVAVCKVGSRSEMAARWLRGQGMDAHNLVGGLLAWQLAGLPLGDDAGGEGTLI